MPQRNPPTILLAFLNRVRLTAGYGARTCGVAWLLFMAWTAWTHPDRLGPLRMLTGLALASCTAACTVLWCISTALKLLVDWVVEVLTRWRLDNIVAAAAPAAGTGRPRLVDTTGR